jgi:hypothetical protein
VKEEGKKESYKSFEELECLPCRIRTIAALYGDIMSEVKNAGELSNRLNPTG